MKKKAGLSFFLIASLFCSSCIILPIYVPQESGSGVVDTSNVKPGVTTKVDVFLEFGNAFQKISDDGKLFTATYAKQGHFFWLYGIGGGLDASKGKIIIDVYEVEIEFDDNDVVKRCETFKLPRNKSQETKSIENKCY